MIPVKLFNASGEDMDVPVSHSVSGPLTLFNTNELDSVHIAHDRPTTVWLSAEATGSGTANVQFQAEAVGAGLLLRTGINAIRDQKIGEVGDRERVRGVEGGAVHVGEKAPA